jgi:protein subunit release factor B
LTPTNSTFAPLEREIEERFVRASGPGGQNVNKVATAIELRFNLGASSLPPYVKSRLRAIAGGRITTAGVLVLEAGSIVHRHMTARPPAHVSSP